MRWAFVLLALSLSCSPPTRFLCDPVTGADCPADGGGGGVAGGSAGGGVAGGTAGGSAAGGLAGGGGPSSCEPCTAGGLGEAACVQGRCVITCNPGTLPTGTSCELPVMVAVSKLSVCVRTAAGNVGCAGLTATGRLSSGSALALTSLAEPATGLSAGGGAVCAVTTARRVYCWGSNSRGELGNGMLTTAEPVPTRVVADDLVDVTQSGLHGCAVRGDGGAVCWGSNLANIGFAAGGPTSVTTPLAVTALSLPTSRVRARDYPTVALSADGRVAGWGPDFFLQGDSTFPTMSGARTLQLPFRVRVLEPGPAVRFAVDLDGGLWLWGLPPMPGLGSPLVFNADAGPSGFSREPLRTTAPPDVVDVCQGSAHVCVLTRSGQVWCWGDNTFGQLGDGAYLPRGTPMAIPNLVATSLSCSDDFTCATTASGVQCWGRNVSERLGTALPMQSPSPRLVQSRGP
ncbi:MAG: hypothetical protein SFW67_19670 [Myxococcaceae bacterium]|nr:hypothetical protein [Myxococcaceae bacterium]